MSDASSDPIEQDFLGEISSNGDGLFDSVEYSEVDLDAPSATVEPAEPTDENPFAGATTPVGDGECVVCGAPTFRPPGLTATGRKKRVPRHCDLHAPHVRVQGKGPVTSGVESAGQLQRIQEELADDLRLLGTLAGPFVPVTGMYMYEQADPFTIAIVNLAKNNQTALRILHRAAQIAPVYTVAKTMAGVAYSVQVDLNGADPHSRIGRRLHVDRAYNILHPEDVPPEEPAFSPPPRYSRT